LILERLLQLLQCPFPVSKVRIVPGQINGRVPKSFVHFDRLPQKTIFAALGISMGELTDDDLHVAIRMPVGQRSLHRLDRLLELSLAAVGPVQGFIRDVEIGIQIQRLLVFVNGPIVLARLLESLSRLVMNDGGERIERKSGLNLSRRFLVAPKYREEFGVPLMAGRVVWI